MGATIIVLCMLGCCLVNIGSLQIGYLMGKKHYKEEREDRYWDMCRQIAEYDDELETIKHPFKYSKNFEVEFNNVTFTGNALKDLAGIKDSSDIGDPWEDGGL